MKILVAADGSPHAIGRSRGWPSSVRPSRSPCVRRAHPAVVSSGMESSFAGSIATPEVVDTAWVGAKEEADASIDRTIAPARGPSLRTARQTGEPGSPSSPLRRRSGPASS